jgi:hypothetical protein
LRTLVPDPGSAVAFAEGVKKTIRDATKLELKRQTVSVLCAGRLRAAFGGNGGGEPEDPFGNEGATGPGKTKQSVNICGSWFVC